MKTQQPRQVCHVASPGTVAQNTSITLTDPATMLLLLLQERRQRTPHLASGPRRVSIGAPLTAPCAAQQPTATQTHPVLWSAAYASIGCKLLNNCCVVACLAGKAAGKPAATRVGPMVQMALVAVCYRNTVSSGIMCIAAGCLTHSLQLGCITSIRCCCHCWVGVCKDMHNAVAHRTSRWSHPVLDLLQADQADTTTPLDSNKTPTLCLFQRFESLTLSTPPAATAAGAAGSTAGSAAAAADSARGAGHGAVAGGRPRRSVAFGTPSVLTYTPAAAPAAGNVQQEGTPLWSNAGEQAGELLLFLQRGTKLH